MKTTVLLLALALAFPVWGQEKKPAVKEPAKPMAQEPAKPAAKEAAKPAPMARKSRRQEDARHCLERPTNTEIIKCAEEYL